MEPNDFGNDFYADEAFPPPPPVAAEETLVADSRAGLTPAEMVERKLASLLESVPLPVSQLQAAGTRRALS